MSKAKETNWHSALRASFISPERRTVPSLRYAPETEHTKHPGKKKGERRVRVKERMRSIFRH